MYVSDGTVAIARQDASAALHCAAEALALAQPHGMKLIHADALIIRGRARLLASKPDPIRAIDDASDALYLARESGYLWAEYGALFLEADARTTLAEVYANANLTLATRERTAATEIRAEAKAIAAKLILTENDLPKTDHAHGAEGPRESSAPACGRRLLQRKRAVYCYKRRAWRLFVDKFRQIAICACAKTMQPITLETSGRGSAWLERLVRDQEVGGSNPLAPTTSLVFTIKSIVYKAPQGAFFVCSDCLSNWTSWSDTRRSEGARLMFPAGWRAVRWSSGNLAFFLPFSRIEENLVRSGNWVCLNLAALHHSGIAGSRE